ncbi:PAAR domain-containing protein [Pseudomonas fluorescens]|uniref:PAAR domain-containing protein n=1 Tax=Pseudomonas fluorescens TaxID=294 RepID=UPI0005C64115|nr:PAAR domain-containing protein [Pseudomonas fluorescens]
MSAKPAARKGDPTADGDSNPIDSGSPDVLFDGLPAAREGDTTECGSELCDQLSSSVLINGKAAVMVDSEGSAGNVVMSGSGTVIIGNSYSPAPPVSSVPLNIFGFDVRVQLMDSATGAPLKNVPYTATLEDGTEISGITNEAGFSKALGKKAKSQNIQFAAKPNWLLRGE